MKKIKIHLINGELAKHKCDTYILPHFANCLSFGGVIYSIYHGGAKKGIEEYKKIVDENVRVSFGSTYITEAGGGNSDYLINAAIIGVNEKNEFTTIQQAVYSALRQADKLKLKTIACPPLGVGFVSSLTENESARAIFSAIDEFSKENENIKEFTIVNYSSRLQEYQTVLVNESYKNSFFCTK